MRSIRWRITEKCKGQAGNGGAADEAVTLKVREKAVCVLKLASDFEEER